MALMDAYFARMRSAVAAQQPAMLPLFDTMAGEARFARQWLAADLTALPNGAAILEVGGGTFLLGCLLAEEGFAVTSIEPVGDGFGEFAVLAKLILHEARKQPTLAACRAEDFASDVRFDFAFSVNVMEHVDDVGVVIDRVIAVLNPGASYRFFCPNYLFPYEPHFNIPTFFTKAWTYRLLRNKIDHHPMHDPAGAWASLNWITVPKVLRLARRRGLHATCNRHLLVALLERAVSDTEFAARRSSGVVGLIRGLVTLRLHRLAALVPVSIQPAMDVRLRAA